MMPASPEAHPQVEQLNAFALGQLESADIDAVESHLASCETCCDTLKQMKEDTFVGLLHVAAAAEADQPLDGRTEASDAPKASPRDAETLASGENPQPASDAGEATEGQAPATPGTFDLPDELVQHGRYRILQLLGSGGMGAVYLAAHRVMQRNVALKVINPKFLQSPQAVERLRREVEAAARLYHPNIVPAHDAEQAGNVHFLVMEYVEGTDLHKVLEERGPLPVAEACDYIRQAALGLQHAHERGMVHRDIKPQNLMVTSDKWQVTSQDTFAQPSSLVTRHPSLAT